MIHYLGIGNGVGDLLRLARVHEGVVLACDNQSNQRRRVPRGGSGNRSQSR